ncbi:hypothetical protein EI94DRAFT_1701178 [Lactarius quietus]|nr:hypothetical protein EI94DRAFT_1701178 [Lactarius quietus]
MSSRSSKHHASSYASSPAWSLNTLTGTSVSGGSGASPVTPVLIPVGLPSPPGSASRSAGTQYAYASQFPTTPGAPHMNTVPLPGLQHALPTPPVSPERSRYAAVLHELLVYTGHRPAKLNYNVVQPPSAACLHPSCNPNMLNEPAISTRAACLVLEIPGVSGGAFYASSPAGSSGALSVREVLYALNAKLSERAGQADFNHLPSDSHRRAASASFSRRNAVAPDPAGLRRCDLLGGRTTFAGLQRAANGADVWIVHFI